MENLTPSVAQIEEMTPRQIVAELDRFIVGQARAKRAVAIALRNRYRRRRLDEELRDEVIPKNILMIGPTGVGKTEIARRLAKLARAPFLKIEASKFTEVGYVGRDVDSMVRELVQTAVGLVEAERTEQVRDRADAIAVDRIVDILQPRRAAPGPGNASRSPMGPMGMGEQLAQFQEQMGKLLGFPPQAETGETRPAGSAPEAAPPDGTEEDEYARRRAEQEERIRQRLREQVRSGARDNDDIEIEVEESGGSPFVQLFSPQGMEEMGMDMQGLLGQMLPKRRNLRRMPIREARRVLAQEAARSLIDKDAVAREAVERAEQGGIIFLDELDKIAGRGSQGSGPDVSREGVQRDLLPIIEGSTVQTKYGPVRTNHILFIAAGAFHVAKPSDLIPELQGRLPIRVELESLGEDDFRRILTEPKNALTKQYAALIATEGVALTFTGDALDEIARIAVEVNTRTENIGARRLHTVLERLLDELSFDAPDTAEKRVTIDAAYVRARLADVAKDEDLSRYIL